MAFIDTTGRKFGSSRSGGKNLIIRTGISEARRQDHPGHSTLSMFTRYKIASPDDAAEAVGRLDVFIAKATATPNATLQKEAR